MSARDALNNYYRKQLPKTKKPRAKNSKPEFEFRKIAVAWLKSRGFIVNVVESKAVWNTRANAYVSGQTDPGFSDIVGVTPLRGVACFIELKAPGKRSTLKDHQRIFLVERIDRYAFCVCTDSIEHLESAFSGWSELYNKGQYMEAKTFLLKDLPQAKRLDTDFLPDKIDTSFP